MSEPVFCFDIDEEAVDCLEIQDHNAEDYIGMEVYYTGKNGTDDLHAHYMNVIGLKLDKPYTIRSIYFGPWKTAVVLNQFPDHPVISDCLREYSKKRQHKTKRTL